MAKRKDNDKCKNLLALFDEVEAAHQSLFEDIQRALKIYNDEEAIKRILREMKDKLV